MMPLDMHGRVTDVMYRQWLNEQTQPAVERLAVLSTLREAYLKTTLSKFMSASDHAGVAMYAALGTIAAGDVGREISKVTI